MLKTHSKGDSYSPKSTSIILQGLVIQHGLTCTSEIVFKFKCIDDGWTRARRGGFNGRPLVQWPTRPLGGWALEAPGPRGPGRLNFGLQLQSPDCNLN